MVQVEVEVPAIEVRVVVVVGDCSCGNWDGGCGWGFYD